MKFLFLHLSDVHITDNTYFQWNIIDSQIQTLNSIGEFDKCFIVFSGDLAYSGQKNEYEKVKKYLGKLYHGIKNKFSNMDIQTFVVPGNHDINFEGNKRSRIEICELTNKGITDEMIGKELERFDNFYELSKYYKCFSFNKLVDVRIIKSEDKTVQINLINSELFSTCNDEYGDDDNGKHYLPESEWNKLARGKDVDVVITVSHRGPEWFEWESCNKFKENLYCHTDLFLYGHEHIDDINISCKKDGNLIKSIARGINFKENEMHFTTLVVDIDNDVVETTLFSWDKQNKLFTRCTNEKYLLEKSYLSDFLIRPTNDYIKSISYDGNRNDIGNYFVFSGVETIGQQKNTEIKEFSEFMSLIDSKKQIIIEGEDFSGKTSLLKQVYLSLVGNYVPIYLNEVNLIGRKPENAIKAAFEQQYGDGATAYEKFLQVDKDKKVVLLDDLNKINPKYLKVLEEYLCKEFGHVISIVEAKWNEDLIGLVKEQLEDSNLIVKLRILPFYSSKRLELVTKLVKVYSGGYEGYEKEAEGINQFIRDQIKLFSLSPKFINLYVEFCIRDSELATSSNKNVFGRVFETSIVNNMRKFVSDNDIDEYSVLLEEIAYHIHFEEKYPIAATELSNIIDKYNDDHYLKVSMGRFCDAMIKAKILVEEENSYYFCNNSYLAYFVAKSLNSRYSNGESTGELERITQNICFNINGDILLFLSYITSNISILNFVIDKAEEHMKDWPEFDIDNKTIGFILNAECPQNITIPSDEERKAEKQKEEKFEKNITAEDKIEKLSLYEYNRADVNTEGYKIGQAIRFSELVCKILPGFNHRLRKQEKERLAKDVYIFPNKIIFKMLRWIDEDFDEIVKTIMEWGKEQNVKVSEHKIKQDLMRMGETYALNIYDIVARLSINKKTIEVINLWPLNCTNHKIQHVMMLENLGKFDAFTKEANDLFDHNKLPIVRSMITRIVRKHFLYNKLKITGNVESIARKYFGESFNKIRFLR